jgi:hypothetical protein
VVDHFAVGGTTASHIQLSCPRGALLVFFSVIEVAGSPQSPCAGSPYVPQAATVFVKLPCFLFEMFRMFFRQFMTGFTPEDDLATSSILSRISSTLARRIPQAGILLMVLGFALREGMFGVVLLGSLLLGLLEHS